MCTEAIERVELLLKAAIEERARNGLWRTAEGVDINITDMNDDYLEAIIHLFGVKQPDAPAAAALPWLLAERNGRIATNTKKDVTSQCVECGRIKHIPVDRKAYDDFMNKDVLVQGAFPYLNNDDREVLIGSRVGGHLCPDCWNKMEEESEQ